MIFVIFIFVTLTQNSYNFELGITPKFRPNSSPVLLELGEFSIRLKKNLLLKNFEVEIGDLKTASDFCDSYSGVISEVAITVCENKFQGVFVVENCLWEIGFRFDDNENSVHFLKSVECYDPKRNKRDVAKNDYRFNLTGDIDFDIGTPENINDDINLDRSPSQKYHEKNQKWSRDDLEDENGYLYDNVWEFTNRIRKRPPQPDLNQNVIETIQHDELEYFRGQSLKQTEDINRWLKIAVIIDNTVVEFHKTIQRVQQYVTTVMNIVSSVYKDPTLTTSQNFHIILTKMIILEKNESHVYIGDAKRSLESVNKWNHEYLTKQRKKHPREQVHDLAVWLTRHDIGGPSGYAPVAGTCDPRRSCTLNKDEGLTSAFIIAHEIAHILGLSHDGDIKSQNDCDTEIGNIMAPMVTATFNFFSWSACSQREFKHKVLKWECLRKPPKSKNFTMLMGNSININFSMDEQCRMEFGNGYTNCRGFDIVEPCSHLWCEHINSPLMCKTKRGPPIQGTSCGFGKWCVNGYCEVLNQNSNFSLEEPVVHNPRDGKWSSWSNWSLCSRTCGRSVSYRTRTCSNPSPQFGGKFCDGKPEEFRICMLPKCPIPVDLRAEDCQRLGELIPMDSYYNYQTAFSWLPHESSQDPLKCQLTCVSEETREIFITGENVRDGVPCSYDNPNSICIQGKCLLIGCDGKINSTLIEDHCGVCGGNGSSCVSKSHVFKRSLNFRMSESKRVAVIPVNVRFISIDLKINKSVPGFHFTLQNRKRRKNSLFNIMTNLGSTQITIIAGTKFVIKLLSQDRYNITGSGPILEELLLQVSGAPNTSLNINTRISYIENTLETSSRFIWISNGWSPCIIKENSGKQRQIQTCTDSQTKRIVSKQHCSLITKPRTRYRNCDNETIVFQWTTSEWEFCSATCGSRGIQTRQIYCTPQSNLFPVHPKNCQFLKKPQDTQPCNRFPCPVNWYYGNWSQCSTSCGEGFRTREIYCPVLIGEPLFTCGTSPPEQVQRCSILSKKSYMCEHKKGVKRKCVRDLSSYCSFVMDLLSRYCVIPSFRDICCNSCEDYFRKS